jgi:predicted MFS family arabinose efflux permease
MTARLNEKTNLPPMSPARMATVFLVLALAHFFSTLIRAVTATLAPTLSAELDLQAHDLGLLGSGYFFGFALMQMPLGAWLDRHGPRTVLLVLLGLAVIGCVGFSLAYSFTGLLLARALCGAGLSACLMGALTGYRNWFNTHDQLRANAWMLMVGSVGMLCATLPVQWVVSAWGWRPLFIGMGASLLLVMACIRWCLPPWSAASKAGTAQAGYSNIWKNRHFWRVVPLGFCGFGGLVAIQTLWASPWMVHVGGWTPSESAAGLFSINLTMLLSFWIWGWITPDLHRHGITVERLITWGAPTSHIAMAWLVLQGPDTPSWIPVMLTLFCVCSTFVSMTQSWVGLSFPPHLAGRALSSYNLVIFSGVFTLQWAIGYSIDVLQEHGLSLISAYQWTFGCLGLSSLGAWLFFVLFPRQEVLVDGPLP